MDYYKKQLRKQARREAFFTILQVIGVFIFITGVFWLAALVLLAAVLLSIPLTDTVEALQRLKWQQIVLLIALNGLVVLFVVASDIFVRRRSRRRVGHHIGRL